MSYFGIIAFIGNLAYFGSHFLVLSEPEQIWNTCLNVYFINWSQKYHNKTKTENKSKLGYGILNCISLLRRLFVRSDVHTNRRRSPRCCSKVRWSARTRKCFQVAVFCFIQIYLFMTDWVKPYWPLFARPLETKLIFWMWPWGPGKKMPGKMRSAKLKAGQNWASWNFLLKIIGHVRLYVYN